MKKSILAVAISWLFILVSCGGKNERSTVQGVKYPNSPEEGQVAIVDSAEILTDNYKGFNELVPYATASPDQEDAGSCLYMSLTGVVEWWLARLNPNASRSHDGPIDLSERYSMNLAGANNGGVSNWKTDSIYMFNSSKQSVRNSAYRFTKGWFKTDANGRRVPTQANTRGAEYSTSYNWIDETSKINSGFVNLPTFKRDILFADPASNQWNVAVMPADIVSQVQKKLKERKAPVNVIYNHIGYWHAVYIVGFDDELESDCPFVSRFQEYLKDNTLYAKKFNNAYKAGGGCRGKGMFYVRDSIYTNADDPYDYDKTKPGNEGAYSKTIVLREYEWLRYMANHAVQIYVN